jgi:hypothetical protein
MIFELIVTMFIATYVGVVIVGHVLLLVAILKCLREDYFGGRLQRAMLEKRSDAGKTMMPTQAVSARNGLRI